MIASARTRWTLTVLLLACMAWLATPAAGQSTGDGTIYSRFGVGELYTFSSPRSQAMGGGGTAARSLNYTGFTNPALWGDQVLTRMATGVNFREISATDGTGATSELTAGMLNAIQFSFPLYSRKLGVGIGFQPYSRTNYRVVQQQDEPLIFGRDTTNYQINFEGRGGLQQVRGGLGYRINDAISVGASLDVIFGILEEGIRTSFEDPRFDQANFTDATRLSGVTGTLGGLATLSNVLTEGDNLSIGTAITLPTNLTGSRVRTLDESLDRDTLGTEVNGSVDLPWEARLGLAYRPDARWLVVLDGSYAPWSELESSFDGSAVGPSAFPVGGSDMMTDRFRMSGGFEYLPAGEEGLAPFFARTGYRLGGYFERSYVSPVDGHNINVMAATAGISLPTLLSGTRIDLNLEVGTRGTTSQNLVRDTFYGISLNVNIGERWFRERKLR